MGKLASATHASMCANSRVKHTRVHASACTLASVECASRVWDVASGRYRTYDIIAIKKFLNYKVHMKQC